MVNRGASPIATSTPVGALRVNIGDTASIPLDPPETGFADYANYADTDLEAFIAQAGESVSRATGFAYLRLAATYAATGRSIKTDDLAVDDRGRGKSLLDIADYWFSRADGEAAASANEFFQIVPFGGRATPTYRPEATPWPIHDDSPVVVSIPDIPPAALEAAVGTYLAANPEQTGYGN